MKRILLVEDSTLFGSSVKEKIESKFECAVHWTKSLKDTEALFAEQEEDFAIGILDFVLPDAQNGEIIDMVLDHGVPVIVFSALFSDDVRKFIWSRKVVDYLLKKRPESVDYVLALIKHVMEAENVKILIVEDSRLYRRSVRELLEVRKYHVLSAATGNEALEIIRKNPDIRMVITDYYMKEMDGVELTSQIRKTHTRDEMAIIGISSDEDGVVSAQFIKSGASDFLNKPFLAEEFYCRVTQNLDLLDYIQEVKDLSSKDFLTGLYNRRYFFDLGKKIHASALREKTKIAVATVDIDYFKRVNDTHGHDVGDLVIQSVSNILANACRETDIVSRFGGEEFCILTPNITPADSLKLFERVRQTIQDSVIQVQGADIRVTASIGVCSTLLKTLDDMIVRSDQMLYRAKNQGRNKVQIT
ncbi:response regulator receiver modulated diguanylate cyclase [Desulfatibacillum aliphaticivorans]|uniref:diguanylate cyclase n=1 Tax=Desulfatibacillum aliphaticivorans TaxID=218208 RepID=B8FI87_DESAL|nr:diguanylate cyclase [Desulfatibacillum aliphaticivorans]ACL02654.1 response regulator receiver modulated diguanylate cyclase [Desulfatibacillum aliphaticivorans]